MELTKENSKTLTQYKEAERKSLTFAALVSLYRNFYFEPDPAAYWMAAHDYRLGGGNITSPESYTFSLRALDYEPRALEFLASRGVF